MSASRRRCRSGYRRLALSLLVLVAALAGCTDTDQKQPAAGTVTIGFLASTTGAQAKDGADALRGAQLAIDVVNLSYPELPIPLGIGLGLPKLGGASLTLVTGDAKGDGAETVKQINGLVERRGAVAIAASASVEVIDAAAKQAQRVQVALVDATCTADYVTELGMEWYFRLAPADRDLADLALNLVDRQLGQAANKRIALITEASDPGSTAGTALADGLQRAGYTIVLRHELLAGADEASLAGQVSDSRAAVAIALAGTARGAEDAATSIAAMSSPIPVIGLGQGFARVGGGASRAPLLFRAVSWSAEFAARSPAGKTVADLYKAKFGAPMTAAAAEGFTSTITLAAAIDSAGSTQPAAIRAALRQMWTPATHLIMPWNGVQFDSSGQNQLAAGVVEMLGTAGFRVVYPREIAGGPLNWTPGSSQ